MDDDITRPRINEMQAEEIVAPEIEIPIEGDVQDDGPVEIPDSPQPKLPEHGPHGVELDKVMSEVAFTQMGKPKSEWLQKTVRLGTIKFGNVGTAKSMIFTEGNMALIFRGNKCMRTAPFVMKTDTESKHGWALFEQHAFFGKKLPPAYLPWERAKTKVIMVGISKDSNYCDNLNGEGYLIKVDENSMAQLPMYAHYQKSQMDQLLEDSRHNSQVQLLWRQLHKYETPKTNWMFLAIIIIIVIIIAGIAGFAILFPNAFAGIGTWFSGIGHGLLPPGTPTH